ncbi:DUF3073 domain-containing protein [Gulosibacter chungangensis]|uniref:DUF3073 domain-containing protein n=1 Tax=Gulosibacter chungangensis TaxID=979746 RepID=A0A7J5BET9_9MICO|nr:DUF3073 domain-containing protein [Gulosibacter chungangensis]KAB1644771.1 DUF3073 domain-containing protein [Gulosibacter chungangensis]
MGRGRQKAKHTKIARELKYSVNETDYEQLQRELNGAKSHAEGLESHVDYDDELAKWAEYIDDEEDVSDEDEAEGEGRGSSRT